MRPFIREGQQAEIRIDCDQNPVAVRGFLKNRRVARILGPLPGVVYITPAQRSSRKRITQPTLTASSVSLAMTARAYARHA